MPDYGEDNVYYLFSDDDRRTLAGLIGLERARIDREIARARRDLGLVKDAAAAMDDILTMLARMRLIAVEARRPGADRAALGAEFERLKDRIDEAAAAVSGWSEEESARIRGMIGGLDASELDK